MSKNRSGVKSYPLSPIQKVDLYQMIMAILHTEAGNVPISVIFERDMDLELMRRALKIELERNDSMRIRLRFTLRGVRQSFPEKKDLGEIPFDDMLGKTQEEFEAYVKRYNCKPLKTYRGEPYRLRFFRAPDGRYGIYGTFAHVAMDAAGVMLFYRDYIEVYKALRDGTELPPPLGRFEDALQRDIAMFENKERMDRIKAFYTDYFAQGGPSFFAGVDGGRDLERTRKKLRKPDFRGVSTVHPFNDKSETEKLHIDAETVDRMEAFCREHHVSVQALLQFAIRNHLSHINNNVPDVCLFTTISRRATLADKNSGGSRALAHVVRTIFEPSVKFTEALARTDKCNLRIYRYAEFSSVDEIYLLSRSDGLSPQYTTIPVLFTFFSRDMVPVPKDMGFELYGSGNGHFVYAQYTMIIPNTVSGGYDCYYEHQTRSISREDILLMHENVLKTINTGISSPEITVGELLESL